MCFLWLFLFLSVFVFCYNYAKHTFMPTPLPPPPAPPKIPTGRELYDALMGHIEPELVTDASKLLDEKYKDETPEHHAARMKRYEAAYKKFDEEFSGFMADVNAEVRTSKRETLAAKEAAAQQSDQQALTSLESAFT